LGVCAPIDAVMAATAPAPSKTRMFFTQRHS
jgi:hypothetical protein